MWEVGKCLWRRQFTEVYRLIETPTWPPHIAPILGCLTGRVNISVIRAAACISGPLFLYPEQVRSRVLCLVSRAYTDISLPELSSLLGLTEERTIAGLCVCICWYTKLILCTCFFPPPPPSHTVSIDKGWQVDTVRKLVSPQPICVLFKLLALSVFNHFSLSCSSCVYRYRRYGQLQQSAS